MSNVGGKGEVRGVEFSSGAHRELPVEVVDYEGLLERAGSPLFDAAQRPSFGVLFVVRGGVGVHTVDFDDVQMVAGRLIFVFPGQIQRWHRGEVLDASVVFARGGLPPMRGWFPSGRSYCDLGAESMTTALDLVAALGREQKRFEPDDVSVALMTSMFDVLVGLYRRATVELAHSGLPDAYVAFRSAVETGLGSSRSVRELVAGLGFSERTVDRACRSVTGMSAKGVLDERLILEAKRLLVHTERPIAGVGAVLGFSEATNFNKFFARQTGELPSKFRRRLRDSGYHANKSG